MTRAQRARQVAQLQATGLNGIQIAEQLGISRSYAYELLKDPSGGGVVARKRRYEQPCVDCGARTSGSDGRRDEPRCATCAARLRAERETVWTAEKIVERIQAWATIYGEPPGSADWNPWQARHAIHDEQRAQRFEAGHWPWSTQVVHAFGSWNAAIEAAGFTPRAPHGGGGNGFRRRSSRLKATA